MPGQRYELGSGPIDFSLDCVQSTEIVCIRLSLGDYGGGGEMSIFMESGINPALNFVFDIQQMTNLKNLLIDGKGEGMHLSNGDKFRIQWANPNSVSYGLEVLHI